eukprot:Nk52_evm4s172 gene=Nk52_evmTU4s172
MENPKTRDARVVCILGDLLWDRRVFKSKQFEFLIVAGRHLLINLFITSQAIVGTINPLIRQNCDIVVLFATTSITERKKIYQHLASMFPDFKTFEAALEALTQDHGCMVVLNGQHGEKIEDKVFWYKANQTPVFRMGAPELWQG